MTAEIQYYLRDYYALITKAAVNEIYSIDENDDPIVYTIVSGSSILEKIFTKKLKNNEVYANFIIPGLRQFYLDNSGILSDVVRRELILLSSKNLIPTIDDGKLVGDVMKFDLLSVKLTDIEKQVRKNLPIRLISPFKNFEINFLYEPSDFWSEQKQSLFFDLRGVNNT